jgi:hypothetical protein
MDNRLYTLNADLVHSASVSLATTKESAPLTVWHRRLCHLCKLAIQKLAGSDHVNGLSISKVSGSDELCNACQTGKAHRLPFPPSPKHATKPLKLIHVNRVEISHASLSGRHYASTLIDDYSRKSWAFPLGRKSEALEVFKQWMPTAEKECGNPLRRFQSDNGGDFTSTQFRDFLKLEGVALT